MKFRKNGRKDRTIITLDPKYTNTAKVSDEWIQFNMNEDYLLFDALRMLLKGESLDEEEIAARKKLTQFSLIWAPSRQENKVVISGLAKPDLTGFKVYGGGVMSPEYLQKHTLDVTPVIAPEGKGK